MTTAARPTYYPAIGGEDQGYYRMEGGTRQVSAKDMPGHTRLKMRRMGQGTRAENNMKDFKQELLDREAEAKRAKDPDAAAAQVKTEESAPPPMIMPDEKDADDIVAADVESDDDDDDDDDDEDETAELMRELERIKKEREEEAAKKAAEEKAKAEQEKQDAMLRGNPLLPGGGGFGVKRRWDDDVVFRNQARIEPEAKKRFINDTIRNDFHKKFLSKYIK